MNHFAVQQRLAQHCKSTICKYKEKLRNLGQTSKLEVPTRLSLLIPTAILKGSKITFRFANPLEGFTELTENCYTHAYGLLQQKDAE